MFHHLRGPLQHANFADTSHVPAIPFDPELEVLVRIKALCVYCELRHSTSSLGRDLPSHLLNADDDELCRLECCKSLDDVDDAHIDIVLCGGFLTKLHELHIC